ncbi:MAG: ROK family protein [Acidimicrobiales bacterium]|nr:ROK family protein [Acidimicrobiales bacterium]
MTTTTVAAGVDLGGTKILGRVIDPGDPTRSLATARVDTPRGAEAVVAAVDRVLTQLESQMVEAGLGRIDALGVGAAGLVDAEGVLRFAPNLPGIVDLDLRSGLSRWHDRRVVVDNDANCAAWAELKVGAAQGASDAILVTLGTGIGGGIVTGGKLRHGAFGFAGEPGHMIVDPDGPPCPCGRRGCWERYASGSGLGRLARDLAQAGRADRVVELAGGDPDDVRGEHVTAAAAAGDPDAQEVLRQFGWWVAIGVANLVNLLDPEIVVIGGRLADAGDLLLEPTRAAYAGLVLAHDHRPDVPIVGAELGADAGAIGAALLALT